MKVSDNRRVRNELNEYLDNAPMVNLTGLAKHIGLSRVYLSYFKSGKRDIGVDALLKVQRYLDSTKIM